MGNEKTVLSAKLAIDVIEVYYDGYGEHRLVGYVTLQNNQPVFGYDASWLASGYELSPIEMPLKPGLYQGKHHASQYLCVSPIKPGLYRSNNQWKIWLMGCNVNYLIVQSLTQCIPDKFPLEVKSS
ncbi:hypothetical protein I6I86_09625 [Moraxella osloensis]|nr:HipA N-terminal domain-containing protein [Moraxella osloensis]MBL7668202.1 hypothetical protein [Moraxella osloensis]